MPELIEAVGRSFAAKPAAPQRLVVADEGQDWVVMPGLRWGGGLLCKVLRVGHGQPSADGSTIEGIVIVLDERGRLVSILDGATLTARRTAAAAAYATGLLSRPDASVLALFGAGGVAGELVEAIGCVRPLSEVRVVGRSPERLRSFCEQLREGGWNVTPTDARAAVSGAQIVAAATTAETPVFDDADVACGTHINAIGSYRPERAEVPAATVERAVVVVETLEAAWHEAGDLIQPREAGLIGEDHVYAELHEREKLEAVRQREPDAITLFKSVGHVALDLAAVETAAP
jgi:ornithine cyclodeaminase